MCHFARNLFVYLILTSLSSIVFLNSYALAVYIPTPDEIAWNIEVREPQLKAYLLSLRDDQICSGPGGIRLGNHPRGRIWYELSVDTYLGRTSALSRGSHAYFFRNNFEEKFFYAWVNEGGEKIVIPPRSYYYVRDLVIVPGGRVVKVDIGDGYETDYIFKYATSCGR